VLLAGGRTKAQLMMNILSRALLCTFGHFKIPPPLVGKFAGALFDRYTPLAFGVISASRIQQL
jgi:hypothetical protein